LINVQIKRGVCVRYAGVVALILSVSSMAASFTSNFSGVQTLLAGVSLVASAVAAGFLLHDPAAVR
jgi:hypothetical protein